jgi:hypothetical protein
MCQTTSQRWTSNHIWEQDTLLSALLARTSCEDELCCPRHGHTSRKQAEKQVRWGVHLDRSEAPLIISLTTMILVLCEVDRISDASLGF